MKKLFLIVLFSINCAAQTYHDRPEAAYMDAVNKMGYCNGDISPNANGMIEVSEPEQNRVTITFQSVTLFCPDPYTTIHYGPLPVNNGWAERYRIIWWTIDDLDGAPQERHTTQNVYHLPIESMSGYFIMVEAYEPYVEGETTGNSVFYEYDHEGVLRLSE